MKISTLRKHTDISVNLHHEGRKFRLSAKNLRLLTITITALVAIQNIPQASAGPVSGFIGYWLTKAICYGGAVGAGIAAAMATGGAAGAMAAEAGIVVAGASAGTSVVAAGVATSATAAAVATEATGAVVGGVGVGAAMAAVESLALSVAAFFTSLPFLP